MAILLGTFLLHPLAMYVLTTPAYLLGAKILAYEAPALSLKTLHLAYPSLFLGSVILGVLFSIPSYFITYYAVKKYREKKN